MRICLVLFSACTLLVGVATCLPGQQASPSGVPAAPADAAKQQSQVEKMKKTLEDWANLSRYRDENAQLPTAPAEGNRVVFMGDSITDAWGRSRGKGTFFPGKSYVNRGISGQTTPQMLIRFRPDVIALNPKVVVILGGTNDLAGNTGPETLEEIEGNLASMAQLATANNIKVVLSSVMPVCDSIRPQTERRPPAKIISLNAWIKGYTTLNHHGYLDYYSAMVGENGMLKKELTVDCLHPNDAGYALIQPLAQRAIDTALAANQP